MGYSPIELPLSIDTKPENLNIGVVEMTETSQMLKYIEVAG